MKIPVNLSDRPYTIYLDDKKSIGDVLLDTFAKSRFIVITNSTIDSLYKTVIKKWEKQLSALCCIIEDGEQHKNINTINTILNFMLSQRLGRDTVVIAFGGGVIGDIAGFVSSIFLRGVDYVQIPTTLLAMVDSSVGGKTGVNHALGKNLIGTFYQPKLVWIDSAFLTTLPQREFTAGCAEVVKYGFIGGREMFEFVKSNYDEIISNRTEIIREAIHRSVTIKAAVVSKDERESGRRALLNFGHTFAHALEKYYSYEGILHGEGVFWGIVCALALSKKVKCIQKKYYKEYDEIVKKIKLPSLPAQPDINVLYESMFSDKKVREGKIRFVLPQEPGKAIISDTVKKSDVLEVMEEIFK